MDDLFWFAFLREKKRGHSLVAILYSARDKDWPFEERLASILVELVTVLETAIPCPGHCIIKLIKSLLRSLHGFVHALHGLVVAIELGLDLASG